MNNPNQELLQERRELLVELKKLQDEEYLILSAEAGTGPYYEYLAEPLSIQSELLNVSSIVREELEEEIDADYMEKYQEEYDRLTRQKELADQRAEKFHEHEREVEERIVEIKGRLKVLSKELGITPMDRIAEVFGRKRA